MFAYYFNLALRSFARNKMLTALMVLAIALGIGASMTTLTVFHILSGDPIPDKSSQLFYPQLDPAGKDGYTPGEEPSEQMTRFDAEALLREHRGDRQAIMTGGSVGIEPLRTGMDPFYADARYTTADFFDMFEAPFQYGNGWSKTEDDKHDRVRGHRQEAQRQAVRRRQQRRQVAAPRPEGFPHRRRARRLAADAAVLRHEQRALRRSSSRCSCRSPSSRDLDMDRNGSMDCWDDKKDNDDPEGDTGVNASCVWLQYWVELDTPAKAAAYKQYLTNYSDQQRANGRYQRPTNVRLRNVMEWLDYNKVVPGDVRLQLWLAFGFLLVCLLNTVGLLLAKFLRRSSEIGVRRALGASRRAIFAQCLVEAGTVGLAGGLLGLGLAMLGLWAVRQQPASYAELAHLDPTMLLTTFLLAIVASLLAGLLPAWRACEVPPAIQLKSQ